MNGHSDEAPDRIKPQWTGAVVMESLHCRRCGYDLRSLRAEGRCPECGLEIWSSVVATVDPDAARLPSLRNPEAVGNSLVALTVCMFIGMGLVVAPTIARLLEFGSVSRGQGVSRAFDGVPSLRWFSAAALGIAGLLALWRLAPPRGREPPGPIWNDIWRLVIGWIGWLAMASAWIECRGVDLRQVQYRRFWLHVGAAAFATIALVGLRGVFRIIGQRSREYRRSRGGRQSLELIIAAVVTGVIGGLVRFIGRMGWLSIDWRDWSLSIGSIMLWASHLMVLIGLMYLVLNAWWIRSALRRPPPPLDQVLALQLPAGTSIPH